MDIMTQDEFVNFHEYYNAHCVHTWKGAINATHIDGVGDLCSTTATEQTKQTARSDLAEYMRNGVNRVREAAGQFSVHLACVEALCGSTMKLIVVMNRDPPGCDDPAVVTFEDEQKAQSEQRNMLYIRLESPAPNRTYLRPSLDFEQLWREDAFQDTDNPQQSVWTRVLHPDSVSGSSFVERLFGTSSEVPQRSLHFREDGGTRAATATVPFGLDHEELDHAEVKRNSFERMQRAMATLRRQLNI
jgi:hypothetical protein